MKTMVLNQADIVNLVKNAPDALGASTVLSQKVFLITFTLMLLPWLAVLVLAAFNKTLLKREFLQVFLFPSIVAFLIYLLAVFGVASYLTSLV